VEAGAAAMNLVGSGGGRLARPAGADGRGAALARWCSGYGAAQI
jgi:hypothetical protein